jgi:4-hydroxy-tetrahydrodipicolinate synthase
MSTDISGVIPAAFLPVTKDQSIHEDGLSAHLTELAEVDGVNGLLVNGHAGESYALTVSERQRVVGLATDTISDVPVYAGVQGATTSDVVEDVRRAENAGADAVMVDAPTTPITGRGEAVLEFYKNVADAANTPVVAFQTAKRTGRNFDAQILAEIASIEGIVAIKEGVWDVDHTQEDLQALRESGSNVNYLMGNDEHLLPCYALGVDGTVVELGAAFPELIVKLYDAVQEGNLDIAREVVNRLQPVLRATYQQPKHDGSLRLKAALEMQERLPTSTPLHPSVPIPESEVADIRNALTQADLL